MKFGFIFVIGIVFLYGQELVPEEVAFCALKLQIVVEGKHPIRRSTVNIHDINSGDNRSLIPDLEGRIDICDLPRTPQKLLISSPGYFPITIEGVSSLFPNEQNYAVVLIPRPDDRRLNIPEPRAQVGKPLCVFLVKVLGVAGGPPTGVQIAGSPRSTKLDRFGRFLLRMSGSGSKRLEVSDMDGRAGATTVVCGEGAPVFSESTLKIH